MAKVIDPDKRGHYLSASLDLQSQVLDAQLRDLLQQSLGLLGILVDPRLDLLEQLSTAALNHVAQQRPWGTGESEQGDTAVELLAGEGDGLVDVVQLLGHVDVALHELGVLAVAGRAQRVGEVGALLVDHLDRHAHGLGDDEDVGEDDGGVDQAGVALNGLEGQGRGDLGVAADFKEVTPAFGFMVLGEVAAGCEDERWCVRGERKNM